MRPPPKPCDWTILDLGRRGTNGYSRLSWAVLDWNENAIALYDAVGGNPQTDWITYRVSGPELSALAGS